MRFIAFIRDIVLTEWHKHQCREDGRRRVEPYRFPVIGSQIRKE